LAGPGEEQQGARDSRGQRQAVIGEAAVEFVPPPVVVEELAGSSRGGVATVIWRASPRLFAHFRKPLIR